MITDHTGWHNALLQLSKPLKFPKSKSFIWRKGTRDKPQFYTQSLELVTFTSVIYVVTGIFSWEHWEWLAHVTARLELSDYSQLSSYFFSDWIIAKYSIFCTNHIDCYDHSKKRNRPRSIYQHSNMAPRLSGQTSIFGVVFFVSKSLLGIKRQKKLEKFAILTRKPRSHARILIYRTWPIGVTTWNGFP